MTSILSKSEKKRLRKEAQGKTNNVGCAYLFFAVLFAGCALLVYLIWPKIWPDQELLNRIAARNSEAAQACVKFLESAPIPKFGNPDDVQVKRPHLNLQFGNTVAVGDSVGIDTSPITFFIIRKVKRELNAEKLKKQPYYLVDVVVWPDMIYLAHKEIFSEFPTYKKYSKRSRTGYVMVYGEDRTLYHWINETMRNDPPPRIWEKKW